MNSIMPPIIQFRNFSYHSISGDCQLTVSGMRGWVSVTHAACTGVATEMDQGQHKVRFKLAKMY